MPFGRDGVFHIATVSSSLCSGVAKLGVVWSGSARKTPLILFRADAVLGLDGPQDHLYTGITYPTYES